MKFTIKRTTNYIRFVSGLNTSGTNCGETYEVMKGTNGWMLYDSYTGSLYTVPVGTLRILIEQGELLVQEHRNFTLEQALKYGL